MPTYPAPSPAATPETPKRLVSLDAYRGFVMLFLAASAFSIPRVAKEFPGDPVWEALGYEFEHVPWTGCSVWDLVQPSFMFMVGVAIPFSYASRRARGDSNGRIALHVVYRSIVLILLGIFLVSNGRRHTHVTFTNVLTQIGLGYGFVYLLVRKPPLVQLLAVAGILGGYWYLFASNPLPSPNTDYRKLHVTSGERFKDPRPNKMLTKKSPKKPGALGDTAEEKPGAAPEDNTYFGAAAHWDKNTNFASDVDITFLSMLPNATPVDAGGYTTLNFVPSMATMIFGLMAGELLRRRLAGGTKFVVLVLAGLACLVAGLAIDHYIWPDWLADGMAKLGNAVGAGSPSFFDRDWTLCPIVKRIWTPSFAVFSAGWTFLTLAAFYLAIDLRGYQRWAFPFVVVGMNSIAMYCMSMLLKPWIRQTFETHLGKDIFTETFGPLYQSVATMGVLWLVCLWLYRRKIFLRI